MRKQLHIIFRLVMFSCILLFVSQEASAQITFSVKNQTIRQTIRVIEKKADYSFFYTDKLPGLDRKISLTVSNESIDTVLEKVFKGSSISYKIESGKQVVLTLKSEQNAPQKGDKKTITGVVADRRGEPLIGVNVAVEGTNTGTITDLDGNFKINGKVGTTITVSYVGYAPLEVKITKLTGNRFVMKEDSKTLDEVVVVGMGTQKRNTITAAVATVNADAIATRPVTDVTSALQGNVAGLNFASDASESGTGGEVGGEIKFNIRGIGSINGGEPYVLVDGVEQSLQNVNPADIESISVLKDASAAAVYGARAAYGVVLVTTKSGKQDKARVTYRGSVGMSAPINMPEMMNSVEFANYKNAYLSLLKTTDLTIYPYEKNILAYLVARQSLLFVCRRPDRIGNDGPGRNTFRSKSG